MIKCLSEEVQAKLRSGVAIPSLQQCVEELILNSIDAEATCVGVRMDMGAFKVQVIDNGAGISAEDMECVGNRYSTSKCSSVSDLDNLRFYGFRGEALASLVSLATLVEISSRAISSTRTLVKIFKDGKGRDVFETDNARPSAGTTVIICNFFHNMPVRRKRMDPVLEGERIRHRVEAISLMHPSVSFTLKNDCTGAMLVQLPKARDTYHRFIQIHGLGRAQKLAEISHAHRQFEVIGYLGKEGHYNNSLQFLYVNDRLLLKTRIHKLLNFLLRRLSSSNQTNDSPDTQSAIRGPKQKRSQELYGVYIINIRCSYSEYDICLEPAKTLIEFKDWDGILLCVEKAVKAFLLRENLVAVISQEDLDSVSPKLFGTDTAEEEEGGNKCEKDAAVSLSALDCTSGTMLASESVYRRHVVSEEVACVEMECKDEEQLGQEVITAKDLEVIQSEGCVKECRDESLCDVAQLEPVSNRNTEQDKATYSEVGEGEEREIELNLTTSLTHVNSFPSITVESQLDSEKFGQTYCKEAGRHEKTRISSRKICLSDPYVHESLQTQNVSQISGSTDLAAKPEEISKPKISLVAGHNRYKDSAPDIPTKIPKIISCANLSSHKDSGSLDRFRRIYGKSELKVSLVDSQSSGTPPQTDKFVLNTLISQKEEQQHVTERQSSSRSPPTLSAFTKLKEKSETKKSLAAKLKLLKQSRSSSHNETRLSSHENIQDHSENTCEAQSSVDNTDATTSGDWLHHYDTHVGKTVYVNRVTGLSTYVEPPTEDTEVCCTSDVTNMAVSIVSEMGEGSNSLSSLYSSWNNPVFVRPPLVGVDISSGQADGPAVKIHNVLFPYRFSKAMIQSMKVIHQVDKKFLACLIDTREGDSAAESETEGNLLVLLDQHAAHERVRLENLVAGSYEDDPDAPGERRLRSSTVLPLLEIRVTEEELRLLRSCQARLRSLGLEVKFSQAADPRVLVGKVPVCFMEKEGNELRRGRPSIIKPVVEEYLREQIELLRSTGRVRGTLPLTVQKVLASLACHGAIKFNDSLSREECHSLVASLSTCQLPFQCAHGRPSIVPLVDTLHLDTSQTEVQKPNLRKLRRMYKAWELYGNR
ncbi:DNA mismatch repair protein Mlh3 [Aulostomus maculatus]